MARSHIQVLQNMKNQGNLDQQMQLEAYQSAGNVAQLETGLEAAREQVQLISAQLQEIASAL